MPVIIRLRLQTCALCVGRGVTRIYCKHFPVYNFATHNFIVGTIVAEVSVLNHLDERQEGVTTTALPRLEGNLRLS